MKKRRSTNGNQFEKSNPVVQLSSEDPLCPFAFRPVFLLDPAFSLFYTLSLKSNFISNQTVNKEITDNPPEVMKNIIAAKILK